MRPCVCASVRLRCGRWQLLAAHRCSRHCAHPVGAGTGLQAVPCAAVTQALNELVAEYPGSGVVGGVSSSFTCGFGGLLVDGAACASSIGYLNSMLLDYVSGGRDQVCGSTTPTTSVTTTPTTPRIITRGGAHTHTGATRTLATLTPMLRSHWLHTHTGATRTLATSVLATSTLTQLAPWPRQRLHRGASSSPA